jgi:uncharacterized protein YndB with AHSA1/START domain
VSDTRSHEHEIEIDAPIEDVWKSLTDDEELTRWYVLDAKVEPRAGGSYWVSWGEDMEGSGHIDVWEPPRRLRLVGASLDATPEIVEPVVEEYTLETRGGKTVLRLVHAGIPDTPDWDRFYDGTKHGWPPFLVALRHYLEQHRGKPRQFRLVTGTIDLPPEEAWARLTGAAGYRALGLDGAILLDDSPRVLVTTVAVLDDGLLEVAVRADEDNRARLWSTLATFDGDAGRLDDAAARWREHALGVAAAPSATATRSL